jgi:hypothetical protein
VKIVASPEVIEFVRARGGRVFVWTVGMRYAHGFQNVFVLEASTESPGAEREFVRFEGRGIRVLYDPGAHGTPDEIHLAVVGRLRKRLRAYWNGNSFASSA